MCVAGDEHVNRRKDRLIAHIEVWRLDLFSYAGFVSVAGALLASHHPAPLRLIGAWAAPTLGWFAAMYGGDYFDRELDAAAKPQRPVPSGRVSPRTAFGGLVSNVALGMIIAGLLNPFSVGVVVITLALGVAYSKYLKARGVLGHLIRGGVTAMSFLFGTMATGTTPPLTLVPICLVFWAHDSGSNVVGAISDREGDRDGGYLTFPVRHGDAAALRLMIGFDGLWLTLAVTCPIFVDGPFNTIPYSLFLGAAVVLGIASAAMLFRAPRPIPRLRALQAHEVLVVERLILTAAFVAAASSAWVALALLVPSVAITMFASMLFMRGSYEPSRARNSPRGEPGRRPWGAG